MPISADGLRRLAALNLTGGQFAEVLAVVADSIAPDDDRRRRDRERKACVRGISADVSADVSAECPMENPFPKKDISPTPPIEKTTLSLQSSLRSDSSKTDFDLLGVEDPIETKRRPKAKRDTSEADAVVDDFLDRWAQLASQHRLAGCRAVTNPRQARILARANDLTGVLGFVSVKAGFDDLFARIRGSPFLLGNGSGRPWKCDIDWVTTESNFIKIMEGKYAKAEGQSLRPNGFQPYR